MPNADKSCEKRMTSLLLFLLIDCGRAAQSVVCRTELAQSPGMILDSVGNHKFQSHLEIVHTSVKKN